MHQTNMELRDLLKDWVEPEDAAYYLACALGIMKYEKGNGDYYKSIMSVFEVRNKVGTMLCNMLEQMVEGGLLERRDEWEYRWNSSFKGKWEGGRDGLSRTM